MRKFILILFLSLLYSEIPERRVVAEWEPAIGTIIRWPLGIPSDLVVELASDDFLYVLVENNNQENVARNNFNTWDVNIQNVRKLVKIVRKYSKDIPIGVGFGIKTSKQIKDVSKYADATIVGSAIVNKIKEGTENGKYGRNLATFIGSYLKKLTK